MVPTAIVEVYSAVAAQIVAEKGHIVVEVQVAMEKENIVVEAQTATEKERSVVEAWTATGKVRIAAVVQTAEVARVVDIGMTIAGERGRADFDENQMTVKTASET